MIERKGLISKFNRAATYGQRSTKLANECTMNKGVYPRWKHARFLHKCCGSGIIPTPEAHQNCDTYDGHNINKIATITFLQRFTQATDRRYAYDYAPAQKNCARRPSRG